MHLNKDQKGLVFNIDRLVLEDGPGIRTTVFLKGCPLNCLWCHSPHSKSFTPQLSFVENRCIRCDNCRDVCPNQALEIEDTSAKVLWHKCNKCGDCIDVCPTNALSMCGKWMSVEEVLGFVEKDKMFYENSGGGITFSGGEPTAQTEFLYNCLSQCKKRGLHVAIDTCGFCDEKKFRKLVRLSDLVLFDIKHANTKRHKYLTGVNNDLILRNLKITEDEGKPIWIRIPLIKNYNDSDDNLRQTQLIIKKLRNVKRISLLPFNESSEAKYLFIGDKFKMKQVKPYSQDELEQIKMKFSSLKVKTKIGG